jgi:hypothetical protein
MRKSGLVLSIVLIAFACNSTKQTTKIEIAQGIAISVPQDPDKIQIDSTHILYHWETSFDDDHFSILRSPITQSDTLRFDHKKQIFKKNINSFLLPFNSKKIDSTFHYNEDLLQCNLSFDFVLNENDYRLYCRFLVNKDYFIVLSFQTPFPVDRFSKNIKDKIFNSLEIK